MKNIDLLLSGGGYRATLFHLGVLRFLFEHSFPGQSPTENGLHAIKLVAGVSGGSLTACHFVANRSNYLTAFQLAAFDLVSFTKTFDTRRHILRWGRSAKEAYKKRLLKDEFLTSSICPDVTLVVLGTSLQSGNCIAFHNDRIETYEFTKDDGLKRNPEYCIADSVMCASKIMQASSAFPPFFPPLVLEEKGMGEGFSNEKLRRAQLFKNEIADGGIRDNLGIEWYRAAKRAQLVNGTCVISDAGRPFDWDHSDKVGHSLSFWGKRLDRTIDILMSRISQLELNAQKDRVDNLIGMGNWDQLPASESLTHKTSNQSLTKSVGQLAALIPTDLSRLSQTQAYCITRLGYDIAAKYFADELPVASKNSDTFWRTLLVGNLATSAKLDEPSMATIRLKLEYELGLKPKRFAAIRKMWSYGDNYTQLPVRWWRLYLFPVFLLLMGVLSVYGCNDRYRAMFESGSSQITLPIYSLELHTQYAVLLAEELVRTQDVASHKIWEGRKVRFKLILTENITPNFVSYEVPIPMSELNGEATGQITVSVDFQGKFDRLPTKGQAVEIEGRIRTVEAVSKVRTKVVIEESRLL